jgi:hypothetical protein
MLDSKDPQASMKEVELRTIDGVVVNHDGCWVHPKADLCATVTSEVKAVNVALITVSDVHTPCVVINPVTTETSPGTCHVLSDGQTGYSSYTEDGWCGLPMLASRGFRLGVANSVKVVDSGICAIHNIGGSTENAGVAAPLVYELLQKVREDTSKPKNSTPAGSH